MWLFDWFGLALVLLAGLLLIVFSILVRYGFKLALRPLRSYDALANQVGQAVESGGRVHVSLGSGSIIGEDTGTTLSTLAMLEYVSEASSISDLSPVATTSDATALPVISDTIRRAYHHKDAADKFEVVSARLVALDSLTMAAGATGIIADDDVRANILAGSLGPEIALMAEAGQRKHLNQVATSDRLQGQAAAFVMADHVLLGEELYVARAYLTQEPTAIASLAVQDVLRWIVIAALVVGSVLSILGLMH
ncbi:MAG: hypothetical protein JXB07_15330 [Anaerolineae bacterium]|nr:hypothetical protein [Anaerolineae bacterium]